MLSFMNAGLICGWYVLALTLLLSHASRGAKTGDKNSGDGYWQREEKRIRRQADLAGVSWDSKETKFIWIVSLSASGTLYFLTGNLLLFGVGWLLLLFLPRLVIHGRKHRQRLETLTVLTDCLRQLSARLPDQGSLSRAMEMVIECDANGKSAGVLRRVLEELHLGGSVRDAVEIWKDMVGLKKFDHVADTLIQANQDGWTPVAIKALDKSVEGLEGDLRAVLLVAQKAARRKQQLYLALATAWSFPLILSMMDTGQKNIFLCSAAGKTLTFAYVAVSLIVVVKGQEYLSLNVDEL